MRSLVTKSSVDSSMSYRFRTLPCAIRGRDVSSMDATAWDDILAKRLSRNDPGIRCWRQNFTREFDLEGIIRAPPTAGFKVRVRPGGATPDKYSTFRARHRYLYCTYVLPEVH